MKNFLLSLMILMGLAGAARAEAICGDMLATSPTIFEQSGVEMTLPQGWKMTLDSEFAGMAVSADGKASIQLGGAVNDVGITPEKLRKRIWGLYAGSNNGRVVGAFEVDGVMKGEFMEMELGASSPTAIRTLVYGSMTGKKGLYEVSSLLNKTDWACYKAAILKSVATLREK